MINFDKAPMFKMREFKNKPSIVKSAIKSNKLQNVNCCYTKAGKSYNSDEYERGVQDQISMSSPYRKNGVFSKAGSSVVSKKENELMTEENKLIEEYYKNYKQPKIQKYSRTRAARNLEEMSSPGSRHSSPDKNKQYTGNAHRLDEEERVSLIARLERRKQELWIQVQSLPVCNRSPAVIQKERELYRNMDDVTSQALLLKNNRVFIDSDNY